MNATTTLADAEGCVWDVAVVGAGPAGTLAARELARRGRTVILLDKSAFPRDKVCGGCINRRAQFALEQAGLGGLLPSLGAAHVGSLELAAGGRTASIAIPDYFGVTREAFDAALVAEAIAAGTAFMPRTRAVASELDGDARSIQIKNNDEDATIRTRIVIAADGLNSVLLHETQEVANASRIGAGVLLDAAPPFFEPNRIYMACGAGGYVGLTRVEHGRVDIAAAFDAAAVRDAGGLGSAAALVFEAAGFPTWPAFTEAAWRGTPALTRVNPNVAADRLFAIGDAAGYVEPFTGEGIACAATTGLAVAPIADAAVDAPSEALQRAWKKQYRQIVTRRQYLCYTLAKALRHPRLAATVIRLLSRAPQLARPLVTTVNAAPRIPKTI